MTKVVKIDDLIKDSRRDDALELGLKLSTLIESGICSESDQSLVSLTGEMLKGLSSLLFTIHQNGLNLDSDVPLREALDEASSGALSEVVRWEAQAMKFARYPAHALYDIVRTFSPLVSALQAACVQWPDVKVQADLAKQNVDAVLAALDKQDVEVSRLQWQVMALQIAHDKKLSDLNRVAKDYVDKTVKATAIADSLIVTDRQYKAMTKKAAENLLVGQFKSFRNGHRWGYALFLTGALSLMGIGAFLAFTLSTETLKDPSASAFSYPDLIWRITLVTGLLGIATYMARQAGQHRTLATWASSICVQLQTFDAYTEQIGDPDQVNLLRAEFAKRVFGTQPQLKGEPDQAAGGMDLLPIIAAIAKATKTEGVKAS